MSKKIDIDTLLERMAKDYPQDVQGVDTIEPEVFDRIERRARMEYGASRSGRRHVPKALKVLAVVAGILVIFTGLLFAVETPVVRAYKTSVQQLYFHVVSDHERNGDNGMLVVESDNFEETQRKIPFKVPYPGWVPEDFEFSYIDYKKLDDMYIIQYQFDHVELEKIGITVLVENDYYTEGYVKEGFEPELMKINGYDVYVTAVEGDEFLYGSAYYIHEQDLLISIAGNVDKETLIKIVESMD